METENPQILVIESPRIDLSQAEKQPNDIVNIQRTTNVSQLSFETLGGTRESKTLRGRTQKAATGGNFNTQLDSHRYIQPAAN